MLVFRLEHGKHKVGGVVLREMLEDMFADAETMHESTDRLYDACLDICYEWGEMPNPIRLGMLENDPNYKYAFTCVGLQKWVYDRLDLEMLCDNGFVINVYVVEPVFSDGEQVVYDCTKAKFVETKISILSYM